MIRSQGSQGKNTEVVCHFLLQGTTFHQASPPRPSHLGWPHTVWLSFIGLDKAVVHVIRLASFLWLWFQCVCSLMPSRNTYRLTWVSLTLDVGYLFTAAPAKCSHCSLPRTCSSRPLLWLVVSLPLVLPGKPSITIPNSNTTSPGKLCQTPQNISLFLLHLEHRVYGSHNTLANIPCSQVAVIHWIVTHLACHVSHPRPPP